MSRLSTQDVVATWPSLPLHAWQATADTLRLWMQIVGKIRLGQAPMLNHWWHVTFYVASRGLTTSPMPYQQRTFEILFDFLDHQLKIQTNQGAAASLALEPRSVADFYAELMETLRSLDLTVHVSPEPQEVETRIPLDRDHEHASYQPEQAQRFWQILVQSDRVLQAFRSRFLGKCSPVHFFWGGFDMAVTRFSGRRAPRHPGVPNLADFVVEEAYSHEVSSCGFWPGGGAVDAPAFYAYAYPEPDGFADSPVRPEAAFYSRQLQEFILPYDAVRLANNPDAALLAFCQSTYEAAANLGRWDRAALEREDSP